MHTHFVSLFIEPAKNYSLYNNNSRRKYNDLDDQPKIKYITSIVMQDLIAINSLRSTHNCGCCASLLLHEKKRKKASVFFFSNFNHKAQTHQTLHTYTMSEEQPPSQPEQDKQVDPNTINLRVVGQVCSFKCAGEQFTQRAL